MIKNSKSLRLAAAAAAFGAALTAQAATVASFPMDVDDGYVTETVSGRKAGVNTQFSPMQIDAPGAGNYAWRTNGYESSLTTRTGNLLDGQKMTARIVFAIDTHVINANDTWGSNEQMSSFATCLDEGQHSGFSFQLGRTGKPQFQVYVGGELVTLTSDRMIPLWEWTSLEGVVDGSSVKLYLNGEEIASATAAGSGVKVLDSNLILGIDPYHHNQVAGVATDNFNGAIDLLEISDEALHSDFTPSYANLNLPADYYQYDPLRAKYHGQPGLNWTNESHGLFYNPADGKYHVFFQRTGSAPIMAHQHWGHIVSDNLYDWHDDKPVLNPTESFDIRGCWSGCIFSDAQINDGRPTILYTGVGYGPGESYANMAVAEDLTNLRQWKKLESNPIRTYNNTQRDTYFFRTDDNNAYFIIGDNGKLLQYKWNGSGWDDHGDFYTFHEGESGFTEMPNVTRLPNGKWLLTLTPWSAEGVVCTYRTGDIDSDGKFTNYSSAAKFDFFARDGFGLMSPTIGKDKDGNIVALGIVADKMATQWNVDHGYAHLYSLPRQLYTDAEGRLCQKPYPGYKSKLNETVIKSAEGETLNGTMNLNPVRGKEAAVDVTFIVGDAQFGINFLQNDKGRGGVVKYNPANHTVSMDVSAIVSGDYGVKTASYQLPVYPAKGEELRMQLFIDHSICDLFINERYAASFRVFPNYNNRERAGDTDYDLIELFSEGETLVKSVEAALLGDGDMAGKPVEPYVFELPANNGRIAFIKSSETPSRQEEAALSFFTKNYPGASVFTTEDFVKMNTEDIDCVWLHIDRKHMGQGYKNLPAEYISSEFVGALKSYVQGGGNLYLSGHATQLLLPMDRIEAQYAPDIYGDGDGGNGDDEWTIDVEFESYSEIDRHNHPVFSNLQASDAYEGRETLGMLWGGGSPILREDHNCMWDLTNIRYNSTNPNHILAYQEDTYSRVLATWGQETDDHHAGIIEFYPVRPVDGEYGGTIIANGMAACQWYVENGSNAYHENLMLLTGNVFAYMASTDGSKPRNPELPQGTYEPKPELPWYSYENVTTGKVGFYIPYASVEELLESNNDEEIAAYRFFTEEYTQQWYFDYAAQDLLIFADDDFATRLTTDNFDCIWINCDRDEITDGGKTTLPAAFTSEAFLSALKAYNAAGGNLYLTKFASHLVYELGRTDAWPTELNSGRDHKTGYDMWSINIAHNGLDFSEHPMFRHIETSQHFGMTMIDLYDAVARDDHNCMWKMNDHGGHDSFCSKFNARVLATWGHNDTDAMNFAGLVEFLPVKAMPTKAGMRVAASEIADRQGSIVSNGFGAYEWEPDDKSVNSAAANIRAMTHNVLSYLSPALDQDIATGIEAASAAPLTLTVIAGEAVYGGAEPGSIIALYDTTGRLLAEISVEGSGSVHLPVKGMVIALLKSGRQTRTVKTIAL